MDLQETVLSQGANYIACPSCDLIANVSSLKHGERGNCARCDHFLTEVKADSYERVIAYSFAALILLLLACNGPFLSFKASGLESVMTLPSAVLELYRYGMPDLSLMLAAFIIIIPALILILLLFLYIPLYLKKPHSGLVFIARLIFKLEEWSMVEVFLIGVIVSLVKIAAMATVVLGLSFWAYFAFTICFTLAMSNVDRYQCWRLVEQFSDCRPSEKGSLCDG